MRITRPARRRLLALLLSLLTAVGLVGVAPQPRAEAATNNNQFAFYYLVGKGFTREQAAAFVGVWIVESGDPINPRAVQLGGGPGRGIAQWTYSTRWMSLVRWAQSQGRDPYALQTQLDWVIRELATTEYAAAAKIRAAVTVEQSVNAIVYSYERCGICVPGKRVTYAKNLLAAYGSARDAAYPVRGPGAVGPAVSTIQLLLRYRGYYTVNSGSFGAQTAVALKGYEKAARLPVNGITETRDWVAVTPTIGKGARGDAVRALQLELNGEGLGLPGIAVNGVYDQATYERVRAVQARYGLRLTGVADDGVWAALID